MYARVALVSALVIFSMHRHTVLADSLDFDTSGLDDLVKNIESVVDMFGGGADGSCGIKCPEGEKLIPKSDYTPSHNGCGTFGAEMNLDDMPEMKECCNKHDACYETCGTDRTKCDLELKKCSIDGCKETAAKGGPEAEKEGAKACQALGDMMYQTTNILGCQAFKKTQKEACMCVSNGAADKEETKDNKDEL